MVQWSTWTTHMEKAIVYAVMAEAHLGTGHTREALDALQVLDPLLPVAILAAGLHGGAQRYKQAGADGCGDRPAQQW